MPNCFCLRRKSDPKGEPVPLNKIDEEICQLFGATVHPKYWCNNWYNTIGFAIAMGDDWNKIRQRRMDEINDPKTTAEMKEWAEYDLKIIDYLEANYTYDTWVEIGKR